MSLSPLRLSYFRGLEHGHPIKVPLDWLLGTTLLLPGDLPVAEREEICDLIASFVNRPLRIVARAEQLPAGHICIVTDPVHREPEPVKDGVVIAVAAIVAGRRRLGISNELRMLRDAALMIIEQHASSPKMREIGAWAQVATDSPATALRFVAAAERLFIRRPYALDAEIAAAGLAETIAWLGHGVDTRIMEWAFAYALRAKEPRQLLSPEAALMNERVALQRALAAGLVERLPERDSDEVDLRRPIALLRELGEIVSSLDLGAVRSAATLLLDASLIAILDRFIDTRRKSLNLSGPHPPRFFVGRTNELESVCRHFEPTREVRMAVVYGPAGIGKTALASMVCKRLESRLEPIWLTFVSGPEMAWRRVANGLGIEDRPGWVKRTLRAIAEHDVFIVIEDVDGLPESEISQWLPGGTGTSCVLVLSRHAQSVLQNEHDAIAIPLGPLEDTEARALLLDKRPAMAEALQSGEADGLMTQLRGHPLAIGVVSSFLETRSIAALTNLLQEGPEPAEVLTRGVLQALDAQGRSVMEALAVSAPGGAPTELLRSIVDVDDVGPALAQLVAEGLVDVGARFVRVHGIVQMAVEREMDATRRHEVERLHAVAVDKLMETAYEARDEALRDATYPNAVLALRRMIARSQTSEAHDVLVTCHLADEIQDHPRRTPTTDLSLAIAGYRAALEVLTRETTPEDWANAQYRLGLCLVDLSTGNRKQNLLQAIDAYGAALTVFTKEAFPRPWAKVQNALGNAFSYVTEGRFDDARTQAIEAYEASLGVFTKETAPEDWAVVQGNLGNVYSSMHGDPVEKNWRRALDAYENALEVYTRDSHPDEWARTQNNLGIRWGQRSAGNRAENIRRAITYFHAALNVYTPQTYPRDWAGAQGALGKALADLPDGDLGENKQRAIAAYRAALTIFTKDEDPWDWARVQRNLGATLLEINNDSPRKTLKEAIEAFEAALSVRTRKAFPEEHADVQAWLTQARKKLAGLKKVAKS